MGPKFHQTNLLDMYVTSCLAINLWLFRATYLYYMIYGTVSNRDNVDSESRYTTILKFYNNTKKIFCGWMYPKVKQEVVIRWIVLQVLSPCTQRNFIFIVKTPWLAQTNIHLLYYIDMFIWLLPLWFGFQKRDFWRIDLTDRHLEKSEKAISHLQRLDRGW